MATKKQKYYVVWKGHQPGIYLSWQECLEQIEGYPSALYKSFKQREEAELAWKLGYFGYEKASESGGVALKKQLFANEIIWHSISVDAAWNSRTKEMEYRGVFTKTGKELFRQGPFQEGTNNVGEFLALVHALALCKSKQMESLPIYSDSRTAMSWVRKKKVKTKLEQSALNEALFVLIRRAESWLHDFSYGNEIRKWNTERWGEIPADFGRK